MQPYFAVGLNAGRAQEMLPGLFAPNGLAPAASTLPPPAFSAAPLGGEPIPRLNLIRTARSGPCAAK